MRLGRNDRKVHTPLEPSRVTAAVVTFVPEETGYFQDRLAVIRLSLASLVKHADLPIDLLVFDNASCPAVVKYLNLLKDQGVIQYLILSSKNVGLAGAYQIIAGAAPGEIIAFANDDVFYYPNWLSPQVAIIDNLPDVGLVSGCYLRGTDPRIAELAHEKGLIVTPESAPDDWLEEFCRDASYESKEHYYNAQKWQGWTDLEDHLISANSASAYAGGVCWQAVFKTETLKQLLPRDNPQEHGFRSYDSFFHAEIVRQGYLRLSTTERLVRHIGNVITQEIAELAIDFCIQTRATASSFLSKGRHPLMQISLTRKFLTYCYNRLYKVINSDRFK